MMRSDAPSHRQETGRIIRYLAIASFAAAATTRVMDAVLPQIALEFGVNIGSVAFVATGYAFTYGLFQLVFGRLGDRYGKFRVITWAGVASCLMTLACAFSTTLTGIALARLLSGVAAAAIVPLAIAWIGDAVPHEERQPLLAKFMSSQILGLLAGQVGGGVMGEYFGWRSTFLLIAAIYVLAVAGLVIARLRGGASVGTGGGSGGVRATIQTFSRLLRDPVVRFVLLAVSIEAFAMFGAFTYVGAALRFRFGFDFAMVGAFLASYCIGGLVYVTQSSRLFALLGNRKLPFIGSLIVAATYFGLAMTQIAWTAVPLIAAMGLGFYMIHNSLQTMATQMAPDVRGSSVAIFATFYFLSQAVGVQLAGFVIDRAGAAAVFVAAAVIFLGLGVLLLTRLPISLHAGNLSRRQGVAR
ncbi:MFS transporter [Seohaeicola zhoushanensis]|nr:MFS transporter [Seohaeicola zhoushanensis]